MKLLLKRNSFEPQALLSTDQKLSARQIVEWFVLRWQLEVTFEEAPAHLGIETQRQWSDLAILHTTPALLGLFSLVNLFAHQFLQGQELALRQAAWHPKRLATFSDTLALVREQLWLVSISWLSVDKTEPRKMNVRERSDIAESGGVRARTAGDTIRSIIIPSSLALLAPRPVHRPEPE
jgi:hypothetical protein